MCVYVFCLIFYLLKDRVYLFYSLSTAVLEYVIYIMFSTNLCARLYPTLCNSMNCTPPGSSVYGISKQEYWSWLPFPSPGDLLNPRIKLMSLVSRGLQVYWAILNTYYKFVKGMTPLVIWDAITWNHFSFNIYIYIYIYPKM